jgi:hypothetical protein
MLMLQTNLQNLIFSYKRSENGEECLKSHRKYFTMLLLTFFHMHFANLHSFYTNVYT